MKEWFSKYKTAMTQALFLFSLLLSGVIALILYVDFNQIDLKGLLLLTTLLCCVFIAKNNFDLDKAEIDKELYIKRLSRDMSMASEELYVKLYENSPVAYLIIDTEGLVKSANLASFRLLALSQTKVIGTNIFDRIKCESDDHYDMVVRKYQGGVAISEEVVKIKRKDTREAWAMLSLFVYYNPEGERLGLMTLVDVTKQKIAENAKTEFVSLASHQLRTPLAGMRWSTELLQIEGTGNLSNKQKEYIGRLLSSIERMAVLIDDFLRVSRFELGTFQLEYQTFSLSELMEDIMSELAQKVSEKKITVKKSLDEKVNQVVSDPNLLRMIFTNLYSNAVKYTRNSGFIHVEYVMKDDFLILTVSDNGMGIPADEQDRVFSKLFRGTNAVRNVPDGTGLGLYILYEAVSVLRGKVTFTTTENVGTTFEVTLPIMLPKND